MSRVLLLPLLLACSVSAFAAGQLELATTTVSCNEEQYCSIRVNVTEVFTANTTVTYSYTFPALPAENIANTLNITQNHPGPYSLDIDAPFAPKYYGGYDGTLTMTYVSPGTTNEVTQSATIHVTQQLPQWDIESLAVPEPDTPTGHDVRVFLDRPATVPVSATVNAFDGTATGGLDYSFTPHTITFAPGLTEASIGFTILPDEISEPREYFYLYAGSAYLGAITIDDNPVIASLSPETAYVMDGDPFDFNLTLSKVIPSWPIVELVSSNTDVAHTVLDSSLRLNGQMGYTIAMRARSPGSATFTAVFPPNTGVESPVANIEVFPVGLNAPQTVTLQRGEERDVPITFEPPPPVTVILLPESSSANVRVASEVHIPVSGQSSLRMTGVSLGTSTVQLYSVYGRELQTIEVTVVPSITVTAITPTSAPATGGTAVTILGDGFLAPCSVAFGDLPAISVTVVNRQQLRAITPEHAAATTDVRITCSGETLRVAKAFTFMAKGRGRAVRH